MILNTQEKLFSDKNRFFSHLIENNSLYFLRFYLNRADFALYFYIKYKTIFLFNSHVKNFLKIQVKTQPIILKTTFKYWWNQHSSHEIKHKKT